MKNKIIAFDFLRALAIIMIIPAHLSNFLFSTYSKLGLYAFDPYLANMGLGLFIFISGYLLYYHNNSIISFEDVTLFYKKRLLRIFPLYWAALATFILVFFIFAPMLSSDFIFPNAEEAFNLSNVFIHALGLQILFAPAYASPMLTLYFVGLIIAFYIIYPFIIMLSKDSKSLLFISSFVFLGSVLLSKTFNIIEHRFFMFFPVFISGILACKEDYFEKSWTTLTKNYYVKILIAVLPVIFVMVVVLGSRMVLLLDPKVSLTIETPDGTIMSPMLVSILSGIANLLGLSYTAFKLILDTLLLNIFIITFSVLEYKLAMKFIDDKFPSPLSSTFTYLATSSYCVYLFHRPFLTLWNAGTNFISNPIMHDIIVFFVALPLLTFMSYHIQVLEYSSKKYLPNKKTPGQKSYFYKIYNRIH